MNASRGAVVVTGASTGIGEACALRLDRMGCAVFAGVRREADAEALRTKASGRLIPLSLDVTRPQDIQQAVGRVAEAVGDAGMAGLVNNAGVAVGGPLEFLPIDALRHQLEVNLVAQVAVTQAFLPLIRRGSGRIVNMGSISGIMAVPFIGAYSASKFALEAVTDALRVELRPWSIHVSIIEAGHIETPIWSKSLAAADEMIASLSPQGREWYGAVLVGLRGQLARRRGVPADRVARMVVHALTSSRPKTRYLVGRGLRLKILLWRMLPDRLRDRLIARRLGGSR